jgi:hypothetical protein
VPAFEIDLHNGSSEIDRAGGPRNGATMFSSGQIVSNVTILF